MYNFRFLGPQQLFLDVVKLLEHQSLSCLSGTMQLLLSATASIHMSY